MPRPISRMTAIGILLTLSACDFGSSGSTQSLTLSGSVSGLSASGLVLANGADTLSVAANATSFTLPTAIVASSTYSVSVQTQPTGEVCSIANGSGSVGSANIANVVVTCATQAFSIGGNVVGLISSGLVLANGSDSVTIAANATVFTLPAQVAIGSSYNITVQTQPTGESCAVTAGMGTMPANAITSVALSCTDQPFTLGGTISGLSTAGLVIANGSDSVSPAVNATTFTMPTAVAYSSSYALSVATQPTGLMCSFGNGHSVTASTGIMPASNVTNTALVCSPQSYALGGTVTGLVGAVVLTDGTDTLTVSASASQTFAMPTAVAYGSQYTLTVVTQPTGLTCTPGGNSTGTMPTSAVSVTVTCAANTYTLGGQITGLASTGLVLANGGGNTVSPASGASVFTLPIGVAFGSTYHVTAITQPSGQACAVTSASGTMPASNVNSVQVSCSTNTFTTAGAYTWTVPAGVTVIQVVAIGAGGGAGRSASTPVTNGGSGALVTSTRSVQPGEVLAIYVGGGANVASEAGGGGGVTYVGDGASNFIVAGGGGGGGGGPGADGNGGDAGYPGANGGNASGGGAGSSGNGGSAGSGGGVSPSSVTAGTAFTDTVTTGSGSGGQGGGDNMFGGTTAGGAGISSTIGNGGSGGMFFGAGGGGGGYGGGGGGADGRGNLGSAGGGGGGSTGPTGTTYAVAPAGGSGAGGTLSTVAGTDGSVVINIP